MKIHRHITQASVENFLASEENFVLMLNFLV